MANKMKLTLPPRGKVKREDFMVEGQLVETQRLEPVEEEGGENDERQRSEK